jgi:hypothetical protein
MNSFSTRFWIAFGGLFLLAAMVHWPTAPASAAESAKPPEVLAQSVDLRPAFGKWGLPLRQQGARGTCSVFTMTGAIEYALAEQRGTGTVLSVEFLNWAAHQGKANPGDGGYFSDLWTGYEQFGICAETNLAYRPAFDPALRPDEQALAAAREIRRVNLRLEWIKSWEVKTGLTDEQFLNLQRTLAAGWPVCAGFRWPKHEVWHEQILQMVPAVDVFDGHSILLVGYREDQAQPGGGVFLIRNTGGGAVDGAVPFEYVRAYVNDAASVKPRR